MSSPSKQKGTRIENLIVRLHNDEGLPCERVPLSGSIGGKYSGDIVIGGIDNPIFRGEVKARKNGAGFAVIERWLEGNDLIYLKRDRVEPFVCMNFTTYKKLMEGYLGTGNKEKS